MDSTQKQKFDFDEKGMEELGRSLVAQGNQEQGRGPAAQSDDSPRLTRALPTLWVTPIEIPATTSQARIYYDMALNLDPENEHAKKATRDKGTLRSSPWRRWRMRAAWATGSWTQKPCKRRWRRWVRSQPRADARDAGSHGADRGLPAETQSPIAPLKAEPSAASNRSSPARPQPPPRRIRIRVLRGPPSVQRAQADRGLPSPLSGRGPLRCTWRHPANLECRIRMRRVPDRSSAVGRCVAPGHGTDWPKHIRGRYRRMVGIRDRW